MTLYISYSEGYTCMCVCVWKTTRDSKKMKDTHTQEEEEERDRQYDIENNLSCSHELFNILSKYCISTSKLCI